MRFLNFSFKVLLVGSIVSCMLANDNDVNLTNGLIAYYEFEGNANDSSGNDNNGTEHGGVTYVDGVIGKAAMFDGVDDYIDINSEIFNVINDNITVSLFIKTNRSRNNLSDYQGLLAKGNNPRPFSLYTYGHNNKNLIHISSYSEVGYSNLENKISKNEINLNNWNHIVVQLTIKNNKKYVQYAINGIVEKEKFYSNQTNFIKDSYNLLIGKTYENDRNYLGLIDDLRIYNRPLTEQEIKALYKLRTENNQSKNNEITKDTISNLPTGWSLLGTSYNINDLSIFDNVKIIWKWDNINKKWMAYSKNDNIKSIIENKPNINLIENINSNEGFWILKE